MNHVALKKRIINLFKGNNSITLQIFTLTIIALGLTAPFFTTFSWSLFAVFILTYMLAMSFGISVTYHRCLTHKALVMNPILATLGKFFGSMSGTGSPIMWVMTHRMHHVHADKDRDPHPPARVPKTLLGQYPKVDLIGIGEIARNDVNRFLHKYYFLIFTVYGLIWFSFGIDLFYYGFVFPVLGSVLSSNALNWFGHTKSFLGYRNYNTKDESRNHPVMALLVVGEGWHNNHHRFPGSAKFGTKFWEFDISYTLIQIFKLFGLVKQVRLPG